MSGPAPTTKVNPGAKLIISDGVLNAVAGTGDPFTDNTGTSTNGNVVDIENDAEFTADGAKAVGQLTGSGTTTVNSGTLTAVSLQQYSVVVGPGARLVLRRSANGKAAVTLPLGTPVDGLADDSSAGGWAGVDLNRGFAEAASRADAATPPGPAPAANLGSDAQSVPEPGTWFLLAGGAAALLARFWRNRLRQERFPGRRSACDPRT